MIERNSRAYQIGLKYGNWILLLLRLGRWIGVLGLAGLIMWRGNYTWLWAVFLIIGFASAAWLNKISKPF